MCELKAIRERVHQAYREELIMASRRLGDPLDDPYQVGLDSRDRPEFPVGTHVRRAVTYSADGIMGPRATALKEWLASRPNVDFPPADFVPTQVDKTGRVLTDVSDYARAAGLDPCSATKEQVLGRIKALMREPESLCAELRAQLKREQELSANRRDRVDELLQALDVRDQSIEALRWQIERFMSTSAGWVKGGK